MKYQLTINQKACFDLGISNINQAHIFALFMTASTWAKGQQMPNGKIFYWVARQTVCEELPLLKLKPDTVYRHMSALAKIGLIDYQKDGKKDMIRVTEKGKSYLSSRYVGNKSELDDSAMSEINPNSEINPRKLGNKSEKPPKNSEINPTYPITNTNPITKSSEVIKHRKIELKDLGNVSEDVAKEFIDHRVNIKKPLTQKAFTRAINQAHTTSIELGGMSADEVIEKSIDAGWQGIGEPQWFANRKTTNNTKRETHHERSEREIKEYLHQRQRHLENNGFEIPTLGRTDGVKLV